MILKKMALSFLWIYLLVGCTPQTNVTYLNHSITSPIIVAMKPVTSFPPPELREAFDRNKCNDYCWRGIYLGQEEDEAINRIRLDSLTDRTIRPWGDYMGIIDRKSYTLASWHVLLPYESDDLVDANIESVDGFVTSLMIPVQNQFPVEALFESFLGLPEYVFLPMPTQHGEWTYNYYLAYPKHRIEFRAVTDTFDPASGIPYLAPESLVNRVTFYNEAPNYRCDRHYYEWAIMEARFRPLSFREVPSNCK